jgi:hypothetical protein
MPLKVRVKFGRERPQQVGESDCEAGSRQDSLNEQSQNIEQTIYAV